MYRVLMPVDNNSERALAQAEAVSELQQASDSVEALVLYVFENEKNIDPSSDEDARSPTDIEAVQDVTEYFDETGIEYEIRKDRHDVVDAILDHANDNDVNAIVMGGRKRSPGGKMLFGSTSHTVLMNTDRPVMLTGSGKQ